MTDNEELLAHSLKVRRKGRFRYSLEQGLVFGLLTFIISGLFRLDEKSFTEVYFSLNGLLNFALIQIVGIVIFGTLMWWMNERTIKKIKELEAKGN